MQNRVSLFAHMLKNIEFKLFIHGYTYLRLFKKIRNFLEQKWLFNRASKGVFEKNKNVLITPPSPQFW
jgi:hypothetical protein